MSKCRVVAGEKYGKLVVLKRARNRATKATFKCKCECGRVKYAEAYRLTEGKTSNCGCVRRAWSRHWSPEHRQRAIEGMHRKPTSWLAITVILNAIRGSAIVRGIPFNLTRAEVTHLVFQPCDYCGRTGSNTWVVRGETFKYNGIDRVVSTDGYVTSNVVPCCSTCNRAKNTLGKDEFFAWAKCLYERSIKPCNLLIL
jgi:hypothetical protein